MTEKLKKNIETLNKVGDVLPMLYVSLISSDSLINESACDKSIEMLQDFLEAIPYSNIKNKRKWIDLFTGGILIAQRDKETFKNKK